MNRRLGQGAQLPSNSDVNEIQNVSNWTDYYSQLERSGVHTAAHGWVGGIMGGVASPRDPVFYLHHGMVDKLYQDWVIANNITPASNLYTRTDLPRYDGTYVFNGQTLPTINPDDNVDSRSLGVFFAVDQLADLRNYTVANTHRNLENFYYQYVIEASTNFIIPSGKSAKLESRNQVILKPGFQALNGASFVAKIDSDNNINTSAKSAIVANHKNQKKFEDIIIVKDAYILKDEEASKIDAKLTFYPNPIPEELTVELETACDDCVVEIFDLQSRLVLKDEFKNKKVTQLNLIELDEGIYVLKISRFGNPIFTKKIIKK